MVVCFKVIAIQRKSQTCRMENKVLKSQFARMLASVIIFVVLNHSKLINGLYLWDEGCGGDVVVFCN